MTDPKPAPEAIKMIPSESVEFPLYGNRLYRRTGPYAHWIRTFFQMLTGAIVTALLIMKGFYLIGLFSVSGSLLLVMNMPTLQMVADALMFSAGFELAFMLFTPGPDEAIEPVILGLAAAVLIVVSDETVDWRDAVVAPLLSLSIAVLFIIRQRHVAQTSAFKAAAPQQRGRAKK